MAFFGSTIQEMASNKMSKPYYRFDGADNDISITPITGLNNFSVCGWAMADDWNDTTQHSDIVDGWASGANYDWYRIGILASTGQLTFRVDSGEDDGDLVSAVYTNSLTDHTWHHIVGVCSQNDNLLYLYLDGVQVATAAYTDNTAISPSNLRIGSRGDGSTTETWNGSIGKVQIFNKALTVTEVKELYSGASVPFKYKGANQTDVVSGWDFTSGFAFSNSTLVNATSFTTAANVTGGARKDYGIKGKRYRMRIAGTTASSACKVIAVDSGTNLSGNMTGTFDETFEFTQTDTGFRIQGINNTGSATLTTITTLTLYQIGAVAEYDGSGATQAKWYDKSGNNLDGTVSGATLENKFTALEIGTQQADSGSATTVMPLRVLGGQGDLSPVGDEVAIGLGFAGAGGTYIKGGLIWEFVSANGTGKIHIANSASTGAAIVTKADARVTIQNDGNVGIGTTGPSYGHVQISKEVDVSGGGDYAALTLEQPFFNVNNQAASDTISFAFRFGAGAGKIISQKEHNYSGPGYRTASMQFWTMNANSETEKMRITPDGNVGIGTEAPHSTLHAEGTPVTTGGGNVAAILTIDNPAGGADGNKAGIVFNTNSGGTANAFITAEQDGSAHGTLYFGGYDGTSTRATVLTLDVGAGTAVFAGTIGSGAITSTAGIAGTTGAFSGLVRIGTSPATHSTISTNAVFGASATGVAHPLAIANTATATTGDEARLSFVHDTGWSVTGYIGSKVENSSTAKTGLVFGTYDSSLSQKMVLDGSGNLGIGEQTPDEMLHLTSSATWKPAIKIEHTGTDGYGGYLEFHSTSTASPANGDWLGIISWTGVDSGNAAERYGYLAMQAADVIAGTEDGKMIFNVNKNGAETDTLLLEAGNAFIVGNLSVGGTHGAQTRLHIAGGITLSDGDRERCSAVSANSSATNGWWQWNCRYNSGPIKRMELDDVGNLDLFGVAGVNTKIQINNTTMWTKIGADDSTGYNFIDFSHDLDIREAGTDVVTIAGGTTTFLGDVIVDNTSTNNNLYLKGTNGYPHEWGSNHDDDRKATHRAHEVVVLNGKNCYTMDHYTKGYAHGSYGSAQRFFTSTGAGDATERFRIQHTGVGQFFGDLIVGSTITADSLKRGSHSESKATGNYADFFTMENSPYAVYLVNSGIAGSDSPNNYALTDLVHGANGNYVITKLKNSTYMNSAMSGATYQVQQTSGGTQTVIGTWIRIG